MSPAPWARWIFVGALTVILALAVVWCAQANPPRKLPTYALESATVWRLEILLAVFLGGYLVAACVWLAAQGRAFTKFTAPGGAAIEAEVAQVEDSTAKATEAIARLERQVAELAAALERGYP